MIEMENKYIHILDVHNKVAPSIIVPEILRLTNPKSVVDVGCGTGTFLSIFQENGVNEILGLEGKWLDKTKLQVDESFILITDLEKPFTYPKKFDLALCLEVAEHLSESSSDIIVNTLTNLSDVIVFSAAVPGQIGQGHINEQWVGYWQKKFAKKGYVFYDELRNIFWDNPNIETWYKQNIFFVIKQGRNKFGFKENQKIIDRIHPEFRTTYSYMVKKFLYGKIPFKFFIRMLSNRLLRKYEPKKS
jgi:SAM-dependent methyltransferase